MTVPPPRSGNDTTVYAAPAEDVPPSRIRLNGRPQAAGTAGVTPWLQRRCRLDANGTRHRSRPPAALRRPGETERRPRCHRVPVHPSILSITTQVFTCSARRVLHLIVASSRDPNAEERTCQLPEARDAVKTTHVFRVRAQRGRDRTRSRL